jgi:hypothetical protein
MHSLHLNTTYNIYDKYIILIAVKNVKNNIILLQKFLFMLTLNKCYTVFHTNSVYYCTGISLNIFV